VIDDQNPDSGPAVFRGPSHQGEAANHLAVQHIIEGASGNVRPCDFSTRKEYPL
jgi:hypothetical protein